MLISGKNIVISLLIMEMLKQSDIEKLINKVQKAVNEKLGVNLLLEIKIVGDCKKKF